MSDRSDNIDFDDLSITDLVREEDVKKMDVKIAIAPIDPHTMIFKNGKVIAAHYRVFAATFNGELEIYIGDTRTYSVSSLKLTTAELAKLSDNLYTDVEILRSLINNLNNDLLLQVNGMALITFLPILKRRVIFNTIAEKVSDATKLEYMRSDFAAFRAQSDKTIAGYKVQLQNAQQQPYEQDLGSLLDM